MREVLSPDKVQVAPPFNKDVRADTPICRIVFDWSADGCKRYDLPMEDDEEEARELLTTVLGKFHHLTMDGSLRREDIHHMLVVVTVPLSKFNNTRFLLELKALKGENPGSRRASLPSIHGVPWRIMCEPNPEIPNGSLSRLEFSKGRFYFRKIRDRFRGVPDPVPPRTRRPFSLYRKFHHS